MGLKSPKNTVVGLAATDYPYLDTLPASLAFRGAKRWPERFFSLFKALFFLILRLKEALGGSGNLKNRLGMAKNPYLDTLPTSLAFLGAKRWPEMFFSLFQTIFFLILELKEASGGSENFQNGLCMAKNPYFDPSHTSLVLRGAKW